MEPIETRLDEALAKELYGPTLLSGGVAFGFAALFAALAIVFYFAFGQTLGVSEIMLLVASGVFVLVGIALVFLGLRAINYLKAHPSKTVSVFGEKEIVVEVFKEENLIGSNRFAYSSLKQFLESKHYVFLKTADKKTVALSKNEELVRLLVSKNIPGRKLGLSKK